MQITFDSREYDKLSEIIKLLAAKRGQPKKALIDMVQLCLTFVERLPTEEHKCSFINAVKDVCEKKIFLEVILRVILEDIDVVF